MRKYQVEKLEEKANYINVWDDISFVPNVSVYETSREPVYIGIVDHLERRIYSIPDKPRMGFIVHK